MAVAFDFRGKAALVTGGADGIGLAVARAFRAAGAEVTVTGTKPAAGAYAQDLSGFRFHRMSAADPETVDALAAATGPLDVLVNNAGTAIRGAEALTPEGFSRNVEINLNAVYRLSHALREKLAARRGCIVNVASMTSYAGAPRIPGYGASKAAIVSLTWTLAQLWAPHGIRVNAVAPGWIETKLTGPTRDAPGVSDAILARTPMGRWGKPEEMAGPVLFLASAEAAGFVTGVTLPVDGGYSTSGI